MPFDNEGGGPLMTGEKRISADIWKLLVWPGGGSVSRDEKEEREGSYAQVAPTVSEMFQKKKALVGAQSL